MKACFLWFVYLTALLIAGMYKGGRFGPFVSNYRPQLFLRTADVTVALTWPEGTPDAAEKMVHQFIIPADLGPSILISH
jgi:translation elongation factor EF-Tu-like GTPase